ncbi:MAG: hypothetical protein M1814_003019 [Vezdaea aestivalis]|nr:MAG: hypothetical protein M1814_003019 [Vezdaea aestivalis]
MSGALSFRVSSLWNAPQINAINQKATSIPGLNPFNVYGRVFLLSWWGFLIAFWSWYAFPPLLVVTIKQDLHLSQADIANSNILSLTATLIVRLFAGAACDTIGPRWTFVAILVAGAIPTALAGTVTDVRGLLVLRFFVGILGGTFIPCQVWTTAFFDKTVVGAANAWAAGFGNMGGGITYFVMPAVFDSLVHKQGLTPHVAWRVTFVVPFVLIIFTALLMIFTCPDTPTGKWSARVATTKRRLEARDNYLGFPGADRTHTKSPTANQEYEMSSLGTRASPLESPSLNEVANKDQLDDILTAASWELVQRPTYHGSKDAIFSLPTLTLLATYFCSFGAELCINSFLAAYYHHNFPSLGQTGAGNWAAMFGLLNGIFRPIGGMVSDVIYRAYVNRDPARGVWGKKAHLHILGIVSGAFLLIIGLVNPTKQAPMFGLMVGVAFFIEAGNGANFALVPHVYPASNGLISGVTGASGCLGGIVFLIVNRYSGSDYPRMYWIIGVMIIAINLGVSFIPPVPKEKAEKKKRTEGQ